MVIVIGLLCITTCTTVLLVFIPIYKTTVGRVANILEFFVFKIIRGEFYIRSSFTLYMYKTILTMKTVASH